MTVSHAQNPLGNPAWPKERLARGFPKSSPRKGRGLLSNSILWVPQGRVLHLSPCLPFPTALASRHMDLEQLEVDTAAAKVDLLSKQLESLWTDSAGLSSSSKV